MPRQARKISSSGFYHLIQRGIGKQIIFEDNYDYGYFLKLLARIKQDNSFELHAYCLMENHFHLLIRTSQSISEIMRKLSSEYASYYNKKYGRTGHLFQDRFKSEVVENREYYFTVIRYIINNPVNAHISSVENHRWSSYWDYRRSSKLTDTHLLLKMIGGRQAFVKFIHLEGEEKKGEKCLEFEESYRLNDALANRIIKNELGLESGTELQNMEKPNRDAFIVKLQARGLSLRQIERLTGIGRGVIYKAMQAYRSSLN